MLLKELFAPGETYLRQIFIKREEGLHPILENDLTVKHCLIRKRSHEKEDLLMDYLDY